MSKPTDQLPVIANKSMAGLRELLFDVLEKLRSGAMDPKTASAITSVANTILKSAHVQIQYERLRLDNKVPASLPEMVLTPRIKAA